jgi:hypothetical protein
MNSFYGIDFLDCFEVSVAATVCIAAFAVSVVDFTTADWLLWVLFTSTVFGTCA